MAAARSTRATPPPRKSGTHQGGQGLGSQVGSIRRDLRTHREPVGGTSRLRVRGKQPAGNRLPVQGKVGRGQAWGAESGPGRRAAGELPAGARSASPGGHAGSGRDSRCRGRVLGAPSGCGVGGRAASGPCVPPRVRGSLTEEEIPTEAGRGCVRAAEPAFRSGASRHGEAARKGGGGVLFQVIKGTQNWEQAPCGQSSLAPGGGGGAGAEQLFLLVLCVSGSPMGTLQNPVHR